MMGSTQPIRLLRRTLVSMIALAGLLVWGIGNDSSAQDSRQKRGQSVGDESLVSRGKYIVEGVAMCEQCHTPRDSSGNPERSRKLEGAAVWLVSAEPSSDWPLRAPRLAGNPPASNEDMIKLLTTGIWRDGKRLRPPMPQFRMDPRDAEAVTEYLRSLSPTPQ